MKYVDIKLNYRLKTTKYCSGKFKRTQINGNIYHNHGLEDSVLLKCQFCQNLAIESAQATSKFE